MEPKNIKLKDMRSAHQTRQIHHMHVALAFSVLLILAFLLSACGGVANPPSWFLHPQENSAKSSMFYGVGMGASIAAAKQEATNDLAQSVQTQVSSNTSITNLQTNDELSTSLSQNIELDVAGLELQNLKITNKAYANNTYYIQVGISRRDLLSPLQAQMKEAINAMGALDSTCTSLNIKDFATLERELKRAKSLSQTIAAISGSQLLESSDALETYSALHRRNAPAPKISVINEGMSASEAQVISGEIAKFAKISSEPNLTQLQNTLKISPSAKGVQAVLEVVMKDCGGNVLFQASIKEEQASRDAAIKRAGVVLYKKLLEYKQGGGDSIPNI